MKKAFSPIHKLDFNFLWPASQGAMKKSILIFFSCISLLSLNMPIANSNAPTISFVSITGSTSTITPGQRAVFTVVLSSTNGVGSAYVRFDSPSGAQAVGYGSRTSGTPGGQGL